MRKLALFCTFSLLWANQVLAQMPYLEEVRALGAVAGQGMACGASKYDTFEMLARAILISKAPSDSIQAQGMLKYNEEKANVYFSKQMDGFFECDKINARFDAQDIFKMVLYEDGTLKMPDGKIVTPRQPYDVSMIYKPKQADKIKAKAIYDGGSTAAPQDLTIKDTNSNEVIVSKEKIPQQPLESSVKKISRNH